MMRCQPHLGTFVEISVPGRGLPAEVRAMEDAFRAVALVGKLMSFHDPRSELSRINRAGRGMTLMLHPWTVDVLRFARTIEHATSGSFSCAVGAWLKRGRLLPHHRGSLPGSHAVVGSIDDIKFRGRRTIHMRRRVSIDLGGIAKGFAVDRAIDVLAGAGVASAVVNAGGDLRVLGDVPHSVSLRHPSSPGQVFALGELSGGALATSASWVAMRDDADMPGCGLVDPRDGSPVRDSLTYTVVAPTCVVADALTKALAVDRFLAKEVLDANSARAIVL